MSEPITAVTAIAAALPRDNVDTDLIWPAGPGISLRRGDQARNAFATLRYDEQGQDRPDFVLNQPPWNEARILVSGKNFGCGSSREMAVWALAEWGLRCVIAPSFGDIFFNNACLNGLLPIVLPERQVDRLMALASDPRHALVTVDLEAMHVSAQGFEEPFALDAHRRHCLLLGLDETDATLTRLSAIDAFGAAYAEAYPWMTRRGDTHA